MIMPARESRCNTSCARPRSGPFPRPQAALFFFTAAPPRFFAFAALRKSKAFRFCVFAKAPYPAQGRVAAAAQDDWRNTSACPQTWGTSKTPARTFGKKTLLNHLRAISEPSPNHLRTICCGHGRWARAGTVRILTRNTLSARDRSWCDSCCWVMMRDTSWPLARRVDVICAEKRLFWRSRPTDSNGIPGQRPRHRFRTRHIQTWTWTAENACFGPLRPFPGSPAGPGNRVFAGV